MTWDDPVEIPGMYAGELACTSHGGLALLKNVEEPTGEFDADGPSTGGVVSNADESIRTR